MDVNITAAEVYSEAEMHPYITVAIVFCVVLVLGIISSFVKTLHDGLKMLGWCVYYLLAPIHMPLRWCCECI